VLAFLCALDFVLLLHYYTSIKGDSLMQKNIRFPQALIELIEQAQNSTLNESFAAAVKRLVLAGIEAEKAKEKK
jgi:hypothetical protein